MQHRMLSKSVLAVGVSLAALGAAQAGGFSRGVVDTEILFEDAGFNMRAGVTVVAPQRGYDTITLPPALGGATVNSTDGDYLDSYAIPSSAVKFNVTEDLRCAGTHTTSFGAGATYGEQAILVGSVADGTGTISEGFTSNEFGATCAYKFDVGKGRAWLLGGVFMENFDFEQSVRFVSAPPIPAALRGTTATLSFDGDYEPGYRIGAAYEIPDIALRAQILYRSEVHHTPEGQFSTVLDPLLGVAPAVGEGTLPQSVELRLQSGLRPGLLAFGSVKWTDWSVLDTFDYSILGGPLAGPRELEYYWKDGWTVTGGLGYAFTETVSGALSLTWDKGVSTTEDALTDSYTVAGGVSLKDKWNGELRFGGAVSYLTSGSVGRETPPQLVGTLQQGNSFAYTVDEDWVYALSASYKVAW